jgi:hypothetical protein
MYSVLDSLSSVLVLWRVGRFGTHPEDLLLYLSQKGSNVYGERIEREPPA